MTIEQAARAIADADALVITAGAGMGVDSGLPDFRGNEGFWKAYPPMKTLGLSFAEMANPRWFRDDPTLAWGFYGHRLALYRKTPPHAGFSTLNRIGSAMQNGYFVFTSNVDGAFQKAGFDPEKILECHGSISHLQCSASCGQPIYDAAEYEPEIDASTFRASEPLPRCPKCKRLARPNILMFGDWGWQSERTEDQERRFEDFVGSLERRRAKVVIVECGAGTGIPTVRMTSERLARASGARLVRINVREPEVPAGHIGIASGALAALEGIRAHLQA